MIEESYSWKNFTEKSIKEGKKREIELLTFLLKLLEEGNTDYDTISVIINMQKPETKDFLIKGIKRFSKKTNEFLEAYYHPENYHRKEKDNFIHHYNREFQFYNPEPTYILNPQEWLKKVQKSILFSDFRGIEVAQLESAMLLFAIRRRPREACEILESLEKYMGFDWVYVNILYYCQDGEKLLEKWIKYRRKETTKQKQKSM